MIFTLGGLATQTANAVAKAEVRLITIKRNLLMFFFSFHPQVKKLCYGNMSDKIKGAESNIRCAEPSRAPVTAEQEGRANV